MPTIHRYKGYRFFFFSNERNEPAHVHAEMGDSVAKFWLDERIALASAYGFSGHELTEIAGIIHDTTEHPC